MADQSKNEDVNDIVTNMFKCFVDPEKTGEGDEAINKITESFKTLTENLEEIFKESVDIGKSSRSFVDNLLEKTDIDEKTKEKLLNSALGLSTECPASYDKCPAFSKDTLNKCPFLTKTINNGNDEIVSLINKLDEKIDDIAVEIQLLKKKIDSLSN